MNFRHPRAAVAGIWGLVLVFAVIQLIAWTAPGGISRTTIIVAQFVIAWFVILDPGRVVHATDRRVGADDHAARAGTHRDARPGRAAGDAQRDSPDHFDGPSTSRSRFRRSRNASSAWFLRSRGACVAVRRWTGIPDVYGKGESDRAPLDGRGPTSSSKPTGPRSAPSSDRASR